MTEKTPADAIRALCEHMPGEPPTEAITDAALHGVGFTQTDLETGVTRHVPLSEVFREPTQIEQLRSALIRAKQKLALYRKAHGGEYVGGVEYTQLIREIDAALDQ